MRGKVLSQDKNCLLDFEGIKQLANEALDFFHADITNPKERHYPEVLVYNRTTVEPLGCIKFESGPSYVQGMMAVGQAVALGKYQDEGRILSFESQHEKDGYPQGAVACANEIWSVNGLASPADNEALAAYLALKFSFFANHHVYLTEWGKVTMALAMRSENQRFIELEKFMESRGHKTLRYEVLDLV